MNRSEDSKLLQESNLIVIVNSRDVNKDLTPKDKDKDLTPKDQDKDLMDLTDKDKDLKYVLKESLRTRTRTTARQIILIAHINLSNVQW